jgi:glycosyltransferase involved in cell wall biosynthesis
MTTDELTLVAPYPSLQDGAIIPSGVAAYTERLSSALAGRGLSVRVLAPELAGEPAVASVGDVTIERSYRRGPMALPMAALAARRSGAAVVHVQFETFLYGGAASIPGMAPALASLRRSGQGPVVTMHQVVDPSQVDRQFTQVHRVRVPPLVARAGLATLQRTVQALSATTVVHEQAFGTMLPEAVVVPLGLDAMEDAQPLSGESAKRALGLDPERLTVLCFGFLSPYKGLENALEAAALAGPAIQLVIAGGSHPRLEDRDSYAEDLRGRYENLATFSGYVPEPDIETWFRGADLLLVPYPRPFASSGPFALALGFGTPILCSEALARCVGAPDQLATPVDPPTLARRLGELASDPEQLASLDHATRQLATGRSWDDVARRHIELYEEVIDASGTVSRSVRSKKSRG